MPPTIRFSTKQLFGANRFLLRLYESVNLDFLRREIPRGLARLISDDRTSLDFLQRGSTGHAVAPSPVPKYWGRLGPLLCQHVHEHLLASPGVPLYQVASFTDRRRDVAWKKSVLYNEYYLSVGARFQIGVNVFQSDAIFATLACNRSACDFTVQDRVLLELLGPHIGCALRNARRFGAAKWPVVPATEEQTSPMHTITIERGTQKILSHSVGATTALRRYLGEESGEDRILPDAIRRWLVAQCRNLEYGETLGSVPTPWSCRRATGFLTIRLTRKDAETVTLLLEETAEKSPANLQLLTQRELEVLNWIAEGKRNCEIASITCRSTRTVEKHVEHIFAKLGTETRTAAMLYAIESKGIHRA